MFQSQNRSNYLLFETKFDFLSAIVNLKLEVEICVKLEPDLSNFDKPTFSYGHLGAYVGGKVENGYF